MILLNKIRFFNFTLVITSCFLLIKTSEAPYFFNFSIGILNQFSYGNIEIFSVAASIIAAYVFYAVNTLIPK